MGNYRIDGASYNTCIGQQTGYSLSSGDANLFIGDYAGYGITTGSNNVLIGTSAGDDITTGANNVIINGGNYQNGATSSLLPPQVTLCGLDTPVMHGLRGWF